MLYKYLIMILVFVLIIGSLSYIFAENSVEDGDYIILVHGLGRSKFSMLEPAIFFRTKGYQVINFDYPSTEYKIQELSEKYLHDAIKKCKDDDKKINFVTHSLGGIIVRYYLNKYNLENIGRVVMLSPPNNGTKLADIIGDFPSIRWRNGPAIGQLKTDRESLPNSLGPVNFETGIITGNRSYSIFSSLLLSGEDDGKVSVKSAKVKNMKDFLIVNRTHTFIMNSDIVLEQAYNFIKYGRFRENIDTEINLNNFQLEILNYIEQ